MLPFEKLERLCGISLIRMAEEKESGSTSLKRTRSLSESLKNLFKHNNANSNAVPNTTKKKNDLHVVTKRAEPLRSETLEPATPMLSPKLQITPVRSKGMSLPKISELNINGHKNSLADEIGSQESILTEEDPEHIGNSQATSTLSINPKDSNSSRVNQQKPLQSQKSPVAHGFPEYEKSTNSSLENLDNALNKNSSEKKRVPSDSNTMSMKSSLHLASPALSENYLPKSSVSSMKGSSMKSANHIANTKSLQHDDLDTVTSPSRPELDLKCVVNLPNFKVYENGYHQHNLKVIPLVYEKDSITKTATGDGESLARQKSAFSLSGFFKMHKESGSLTHDIFYERATSLIANKQNNGKYVKQKEEERNGNKVPQIVNPHAAVGSEELKLINALSEDIRRGLKNHKSKKPETEEPSPNDENANITSPTCSEKYGKAVGVIGHGAYGIVKVCARPKTKDDIQPLPTYTNGQRLFFAVKELKPKTNADLEKFCTRVTSEFIIGHSLSQIRKGKDGIGGSSNILKVLDIMEYDNTFVEVMEFCPSGDLYSLLTNRTSKIGTSSGNNISSNGVTPLHPLEADCFMKQLLHGVQYMHDHGIAHCDLKPENILFHPNGLLKICDFGTSSVFQTAWEKQVHFQSGAMGSEPYVAPEEFCTRGDEEYDPRLVDCWSCGIVYCTMILGHYLWKVAIPEKDGLFKSFLEEMKSNKGFHLFEELRHVNMESNRLRKIALYNIFQVNPAKRITVDKLLETAWMKRTICCVMKHTTL